MYICVCVCVCARVCVHMYTYIYTPIHTYIYTWQYRVRAKSPVVASARCYCAIYGSPPPPFCMRYTIQYTISVMAISCRCHVTWRWPSHYIAIANIVWCMAFKEGVGGGASSAQRPCNNIAIGYALQVGGVNKDD